MVGLRNLGKTSCINSVLQPLHFTTEIHDYFLSGEYKKDLNQKRFKETKCEVVHEFANHLNHQSHLSNCKNKKLLINNSEKSLTLEKVLFKLLII